MIRRLISLGVSTTYAGLTKLHNPPLDRCIVLYYHGVKKHQVARFSKQMAWLKSQFDVIPLRAMATATWSGRCACITFDDGLDNVRQNALPVLRELGLPATMFVVPGNLGDVPRWTIDDHHPDRNELLSTAEQLRDYPADLIDIGSHTMTHPNLTTLSGGRLRAELANPKKDLEVLFDREVVSLSVPFGAYNEETLRAARAAGYALVATCDPVLARPGLPDFRVGRFKVEPDDWDLEFRFKARGHYRWRRNWQKLRRHKLKQSATQEFADFTVHAGLSD